MIDEQDFSVVESELDPAPLDDADEPPLDADAAAGQPLVVIEYRNRVLPTLLLLPPLLALVLGVVIVYFRAQIADWPGIRELRIVPRAAVVHRPARSTSPTTGAQADEAVVSATDTAAAGSPWPSSITGHPTSGSKTPTAAEFPLPELVPPGTTGRIPADPAVRPLAGEKTEPTALAAAVADDQPPGPLPLEKIVPAPKPKPTEPPPAIGFDPPGAARLTPPDLDAPNGENRGPGGAGIDSPEDLAARTKRINEDISREATLRAAEEKRKQQLEAMKPLWREQSIIDAQRRRQQEIREALEMVEEDRPKFRASLQEILSTSRNTQATAHSITLLCNQYGMEALEEIEQLADRSISLGPAARYRRADKVRHFRRCGFSEARILDILAADERKNISAKTGPRNEAEAIIRGARQLLSVPLAAPNPAAKPARPGAIVPSPSTAPARPHTAVPNQTPAARPRVANQP